MNIYIKSVILSFFFIVKSSRKGLVLCRTTFILTTYYEMYSIKKSKFFENVLTKYYHSLSKKASFLIDLFLRLIDLFHILIIAFPLSRGFGRFPFLILLEVTPWHIRLASTPRWWTGSSQGVAVCVSSPLDVLFSINFSLLEQEQRQKRSTAGIATRL